MAATGLVEPLLVEAAALSRGMDRGDLADRLEDLRVALARAAARTEVTVALVGEPGRGKSSLLNALVGRPDLSPASPGVDTGVPLVVGFAEEESAWAVVPDGDGGAARSPIPSSAVHALVRVGARGRPSGAGEPAWVEVGLPDPWLKGKRFVDTPGVGGLTPSHGRLAAMAMAEADVVVCLTDAAAPMARPEAEFVAAAAARVASVVVVLAKKDAFAEWARIQEANREAVAALTDRAIPYLAVSSTLAERVHRGGVPEAMREAVAQSSGLDALRDHLDRFAATGPAALAEAAAAQVLERVAAEIQQNAALRVAALKAPPEELAALNAEVRRQQEALGERNRAAARKISSRTLNRTRLCRHDFDERARQIRADFRRRALEGPLDELESLPDRLRAELAAAAAIAMTAFPDAVAAMAADLEALLPGGVPDADLGSDEPVSFASDLGEPGSASATPGSTMALIGGASMGASIVRLTLGALPLSGALTVVPWIGAALTAAAGVALAWRRLRSQGEAGRRNGVAVWVDRASADVLAEFARTCDRRQMELADLVESTVEQVFSARTAALEQVRLQLAQVTAADQRERPALAAAAQEQAARAERLSAACRGVAALRWDASAMAAGGSAGEGVR